MRRVLLTGMSGVGKSSIATALKARGYIAVDTDREASLVEADGEWLWDEHKIDRLLSAVETQPLFIAGSASNQPQFYARFDQIVLLSAPTEVMIERVRTRTTNSFGKTEEELSKILKDKEVFEPMLRRRAHHELDTDRPLEDVVDDLLALVLPGSD